MRHIDGVKVGAAQSARLGPGSRLENVRHDSNGWDAEAFQPGRVVQTARCAGSSIRQRLDHRLHLGPPQTVENSGRRRLGEGGFGLAYHLANSVVLFQ